MDLFVAIILSDHEGTLLIKIEFDNCLYRSWRQLIAGSLYWFVKDIHTSAFRNRALQDFFCISCCTITDKYKQ